MQLSFLTKSMPIRNIGISIFEQGLYSVNNFVLNILLARSITSTSYGIYSVAFSIFLFAAGFQNALILEPMSVLVPTIFQENIKGYFNKILLLNTILTFSLSIFIYFGYILIPDNDLTELVFPLILTLPCILNYWFGRRFCYAIQKPSFAFFGSSVYTFFLLGSTFLLFKKGVLSSQIAFYLMGISGLISSLFIILQISLYLKNNKKGEIRISEIISPHWKYGKWATGSSIVYWLNSSVIVPFTAIFIGYSDAGIIRALQNFTVPVQQFVTAISNYLLPGLSSDINKSGSKFIHQKTRKILYLVLSFVFIYVFVLSFFRKEFIALVFPFTDYIHYSWLILFLGIALLFSVANQIISISLRACQRPDGIFWSQIIGVLVFSGLGIFIINKFELVGAGIMQIVLALVNLIVIIFFYKSLFKQE